MSDFLLRERDGAVLTVTMNRPEQRNALSDPEQIGAFEDLRRDVEADPTIRAIVLTGAGSAFCAGGNVKDMRDRKGMFEGSPYRLRNRYREGIQRIPVALYELEIPVVAAINGPAIGAGLDLANMCDVRIAADTATFAESFVKLGIIPGDGGAWFLPRVVGMPRATLMALTGEMIDAATALAWGLVTEVRPREELLRHAQDIAHKIAANPVHALRLTKRLLREGQNMNLGSLLEMSAAYQALAHFTADHEEAIAAFMEKRMADFDGQ